jgi:hypothetical protein
MHLEVSSHALVGTGDAVRRAAGRLDALALPAHAPDCGDLAAEDAVGALLAVSSESLAVLAHELRCVAVLVDVAAVDYSRTEARLSGGAGAGVTG